ncbi:hypothetical protein B0J14DRAFT_582450 [Halenospora varia]|nr:hypothetical protein B0J14DRAFT_582450 [Halenospora varia]
MAATSSPLSLEHQVCSLWELRLRVIEDMFVPQPPCIGWLFDRCYDHWTCRAGSHPTDKRTLVVPDEELSRVDPLLYEEGHKAFYKHNVFVFNQGGGSIYEHDIAINVRDYTEEQWRALRDRAAHCILSFVNLPLPHTRRASVYPQLSERFQRLIQHIVFCLADERWWHIEQLDWDWPLMVVWETLPNLKTLCLDLCSFSRRSLCRRPETEGGSQEKLVNGAGRMSCLNLRKLTLVGLCSGPYWSDEEHKNKMMKLFKPAMADDGKIEFMDWDGFTKW